MARQVVNRPFEHINGILEAAHPRVASTAQQRAYPPCFVTMVNEQLSFSATKPTAPILGLIHGVPVFQRQSVVVSQGMRPAFRSMRRVCRVQSFGSFAGPLVGKLSPRLVRGASVLDVLRDGFRFLFGILIVPTLLCGLVFFWVFSFPDGTRGSVSCFDNIVTRLTDWALCVKSWVKLNVIIGSAATKTDANWIFSYDGAGHAVSSLLGNCLTRLGGCLSIRPSRLIIA